MNEPEININNKHARFQDAQLYDCKPLDIIVGGAGGIGSWVSMFLSRIGHTLYIFDNDAIDETNMAGQLYRINQIGVNKAEATKQNIELFTDNKNTEVFGLYDDNSPTSPIVFSCFDNMKARKLMFEKWKAQENRDIFIDGRMLAEIGMVFCVTKGKEVEYEAELFDDSEVRDAPCSFKATSHCGALIGSLMTSGLNNFIVNKKLGEDFRELPFKFTFELPLFNFEIPVNEAINVVIEELKTETNV